MLIIAFGAWYTAYWGRKKVQKLACISKMDSIQAWRACLYVACTSTEFQPVHQMQIGYWIHCHSYCISLQGGRNINIFLMVHWSAFALETRNHSLSEREEPYLIQYAEADSARRIDVGMEESLWKLALHETHTFEDLQNPIVQIFDLIYLSIILVLSTVKS